MFIFYIIYSFICLISKVKDSYFIFSSSGVSLTEGISEVYLEHSNVKKVMVQHSEKKILLEDDSKFDKVFLSKTASLNEINYLVTNKYPDNRYIDYCKDEGIELIVAK